MCEGVRTGDVPRSHAKMSEQKSWVLVPINQILDSQGSIARVWPLLSGGDSSSAKPTSSLLLQKSWPNKSSVASSSATSLSPPAPQHKPFNISPAFMRTAAFARLPRIPFSEIFAGHMPSFTLGFHQSLVIREAPSRGLKEAWTIHITHFCSQCLTFLQVAYWYVRY